MSDFQPRYVAYARAHGRTPEDMLAHDRKRCPGGRMAGFIIWIGGRWRDWEVEAGAVERRRRGGPTDEDHRAFDAWLDAVDRETAGSAG